MEGDDENVERRRATCDEWFKLGDLLIHLLGGPNEPDEETRKRMEDADRRIREENPAWSEDKLREKSREAQEAIAREERERRMRQARREMEEASREMDPHVRARDRARQERAEADGLAAKSEEARKSGAKLRDEAAARRSEARAAIEAAEAEEKKGERHNGLYAKARRDAANKAGAAADRLEAKAAQAAEEAAGGSRAAQKMSAGAAEHEAEADRAMQEPRRKFEEARGWVLREQAQVVRESQIARMDTLGAEAFNPGEHKPAGGKHHLALASYVLDGGDSPWTGTWGKDSKELGERIVTPELAHALMSSLCLGGPLHLRHLAILRLSSLLVIVRPASESPRPRSTIRAKASSRSSSSNVLSSGCSLTIRSTRSLAVGMIVSPEWRGSTNRRFYRFSAPQTRSGLGRLGRGTRDQLQH